MYTTHGYMTPADYQDHRALYDLDVGGPDDIDRCEECEENIEDCECEINEEEQ